MSTQPYQSPDLQSSDSRRDPNLEPISADAADQVRNSASPSTEAQKDARQQDSDDPRTRAEGQAQSPGEVPDDSDEEALRKRDEEEEELDDAIDDSFPASDPVSPASTPKKR